MGAIATYIKNKAIFVDPPAAIMINSDHIFVDDNARDTYFTTNPTEKTLNLFISVGVGFQQWNGTIWVDKTAVVQGVRGLPGGTNYIYCNFSFTDFAAGNKVIGTIPSGTVIDKIELSIINNINSGVITVGTIADPDALWLETDSTLNTGNDIHYQKDVTIVLGINTEYRIFLPIGATSGSGSIYIYYS